MKQFLKKKQLMMVALVAALGMAVYLNYYFAAGVPSTDTTGKDDGNLGDAQFVGSQVDDGDLEKGYFEELFGTPHGLDFSHVVKMYGGDFIRVKDWEHFRQAVVGSFEKEGIKVIEVQTNREENVQSHRKLWNNVSQEINLSFIGEINAN